MSSLREYLYIDDVEINSILAQINEGLDQKTTRAEKHNEINELGHHQSSEVKGTGEVKIPLVAEGKVDVSGLAGRNSNYSQSDGKENIVESIYNDYGVELLERQLQEDHLLKAENDELHFGDFIIFNQPFDIVDFSVIETAMNPQKLLEFMSMGASESAVQSLTSQIHRQERKSQKNMDDDEKKSLAEDKAKLEEMTENIKQAKNISENVAIPYEFGKLGNNLFQDSVLIHGSSYNAYAERNHFRFNKVQLSMLHDNPRNGTIIGIIENTVHIDESPFDKDELTGIDLSKVDSYLINTIFANFGLAEEGSLMVKPLAIYFD